MFLYNIIISPLEYIIENLFSIFNYVIGLDIICSVFFISFVVTMLCLPFYCRADKIRKENDEKLLELEPYIKKIKSNFKGDELYFMLQTLYRQHNYNPILSLRNSFSLLLQIPFFIAAYHFFSNLELFNGLSCGILKDLSKPDMLINFGGLSLNLLPIIMTLINIMSCEMYIKSTDIKARIQPYSLAIIFLFVLYDSPSILVIYWTFNNFFYLLKNKYLDTNPKKYVWILLSLTILMYFLGNYRNFEEFNYLFLQIAIVILIFVLSYFGIQYIKNNYSKIRNIIKISTNSATKLFIFCGIGLILLQGIIIPFGLLTSDLSFFATELDDTKNITKVVVDNIFCLTGLYLFWGLICFYIIKKEYRVYFSIILLSILFFSLFNYLNFGNDLGTISFKLAFERSNVVEEAFGNLFYKFLNACVFVFILTLIVYAFKKSFVKLVSYITFVLLLSELIVSGIYIHKLKSGIEYIDNCNIISKQNWNLPNYIELSKTGKNVILIFLDRFSGCLLPMLLEERPELKNVYSGFVFYPNTLSYHGCTVLAYPPLVGGYEYIPSALDKDKRSFSEKWLEASIMLLTLFKNNGYLATVMDPMGDYDPNMRFYKEDNFSNLYSSRGLNYIKMAGRYNHKFQIQKNEDNFKVLQQLQKNLYLYSFFNIAAKFFKTLIYDNGNYLLARRNNDYHIYESENAFISAYSSLYYIKDITKITNDKNTFTLINNDLPHNMHYLQYPDYEYVKNVTNLGIDRLKYDRYNNDFKSYHTSMASLLLVGKYLKFLKESGVYDNTRIIIVSDHGNGYIYLPHFTEFQNRSVAPYNPLLLVKDYNQNFELKTDNAFMTNADVPYLLTKDLINNAKNPFTGKPLFSDEKLNGVDVYINRKYWNTSHFTSNRVILDKFPVFMHVKTGDIFDESNWKLFKYKNKN